MVEIKPLHSCFLQLNHILYRLSWANLLHEELNEPLSKVDKQEHPKDKSERIRAKSVIYLDYIFLNLDQLIEIHDRKLGKVLNEIGFSNLLQCMEDLWAPIKKLKGKIELWRNNYVAHSTKQASDFNNLKEIDPDYENTIKKVFFASRLACLYIYAIFTNLKSDYQLALSLQKLQLQSSGGRWEWRDYQEYWNEMKKMEDVIIA